MRCNVHDDVHACTVNILELNGSSPLYIVQVYYPYIPWEHKQGKQEMR